MTATLPNPSVRPIHLLLLALLSLPLAAFVMASTTRLAPLLRSASSSRAAAAGFVRVRPIGQRGAPATPAALCWPRRAGLSVMNLGGPEAEGGFAAAASSTTSSTSTSGSSTEEAGGDFFFRTGLPPIPFPKEPQISPLSTSSSTPSSTSTSSKKKKGSSSGSKLSRPSKREKPALPPQPLPKGIAGALPNKSGGSGGNATAAASGGGAGDRTITSSSGVSVNISGGVFGNNNNAAAGAAASSYSSLGYRNPGLYPAHPRAAVAVTIATKPSAFDKTIRYCLVKRGKDPGKGLWSLPGGSIELGEETLRAAAREAQEETGLTKEDLRFYPHTICTTDAIYRASGVDGEGEGEGESGGSTEVKFHYLIAQHAAWINSGAVERAKAGDDAEALRFCTLEEIKQMTLDGSVVGNVCDVVLRIERLITKGVISLDFDLVELQ